MRRLHPIALAFFALACCFVSALVWWIGQGWAVRRLMAPTVKRIEERLSQLEDWQRSCVAPAIDPREPKTITIQEVGDGAYRVPPELAAKWEGRWLLVRDTEEQEEGR